MIQIISLIIAILILKGIQYYHFFRNKDNLYVLIKKKTYIFSMMSFFLLLLNLYCIIFKAFLIPFLVELMFVNIAIGNLLKVTDILKKNFLVKNLEKGLFIKVLIAYKLPLIASLLILIEVLFSLYLYPNILIPITILFIIFGLYFVMAVRKAKKQ